MTAQVLQLRNPPRWGRVDTGVVLGIFLAGFVVIAAIGRDYGRSWDEPGTADYAQRTLRAYAGQPVEAFADLSFYGPAYLVVSELIAEGIERSVPGWTALEGRHAAYFLSFVIAIVSVYVLARGHVGTVAALVGALLFATQPLFFGHAFINPKDMPFVGLFAGAAALGVTFARAMPLDLGPGHLREFIGRWRSIHKGTRLALSGLAVMVTLVLADVLVARKIVLPGLLRLVRDAYDGRAIHVVQILFNRVATDHWKTGVDAYLLKAEGIYNLGAVLVVIVVAVTILVWLLWLFAPSWKRHLPLLASAGLVAGLATSVRVVGPLAALLVSTLIVFRLRWQAPIALVVYWLVLALTAYASWPFLWENPLTSAVEAFQMMSRFPWHQEVLFAGQAIPAADLPWYYAPMQFSFQLTLPSLVFGLVGGIAVMLGSRRGIQKVEAAVLWTWLGLPFILVVAFDSVLYDGGRQLLFALLPIFVMGAVAFEVSLKAVPKTGIRLGVAALAILPGLFSLVALHPYQYIYYNELTGGVAGAFRRFELDYWGTAYREAILALDEVAPQGASVGVAGPWEAARPYSRPDMSIFLQEEESEAPPDFFLVTARWNLDRRLWPDAPEIFAVRRAGALLARVVDLRGLKRD